VKHVLLPFSLASVIATASAQVPTAPPPSGLSFQIEDDSWTSGRGTVTIHIFDVHGHTKGEIRVIHWHPRPSPAEAELDSTALAAALNQRAAIERQQLEEHFACRSWENLAEYHGDWGWVCVTEYPRGKPDWHALGERFEEYMSRRAQMGEPYPPLDPAGCRVGRLWRITVWDRRSATGLYSALPVRPNCGSLNEEALRFNDEGGALIDSVKALGMR